LHRIPEHRQSDYSRGSGHGRRQVMTVHGIGAAVRRKEDRRFLTGLRSYTDDLNRPGQLHAVILRSPHAHARILGIDTAAAANMPGVVAILPGADMAKDNLGSIPCGWLVKNKDGSPMDEPPQPPRVAGIHRH